MAKDRQSGKLAVILHADVVDSTQLVQVDEHLAHERIQETFNRFGKTIGRFSGRILELRGDALLAEFEKPSDAVAATLAFQSNHIEYLESLEGSLKPGIRVGIAMGEVVIADNTVTGAGVVLAQRVEQLAVSGGLCITAAIHEALSKRLPFDLEDIGEQELKGFDYPVRVYRVNLRTGASIPDLDPGKSSKTAKTLRPATLAFALVVLISIAALVFWYQPWQAREIPASIENMALPLPDKPSIAVLPFDNLGGNPDQDYLDDALTDNVITELSRFRDFFVIARDSAEAYKNQPVNKVAENLGVRYIVKGNIQAVEGKIRVTVQLIDAVSGRHLWAERFDRELKNLLTVQDEITQTVVSTLGQSIDYTERERAASKPVANLTAVELRMRAREEFLKFTKEGFLASIPLAEKAIEIDPDYPIAYVHMAWVHIFDYRFDWLDTHTREESRELALQWAEKAVELDPHHYETRWALAAALAVARQTERAAQEYNRAIELNPNSSDVLADSTEVLGYLGRADEAVLRLQKAMRLNPKHPDWYHTQLGWAHYFAGDYEAALASIEKVGTLSNAGRRTLAPVLVRLGRLDEARAVMAEFLESEPGYSLEDMKVWPFKHEAYLEKWTEDQHRAGVPEHPPLELPDKPSIAVLPFTNMSGDPEQEYFADGMTEDLITDLSKISGLFVIARNSSFTYKGKSVKVRQVGEELGVKYVMEGSVRRAGDQVRINAQLIDATTGGHLWADRYDGSMQDIFGLTDQVTGQIVSALKVKLTPEEAVQQAQRSTDSGEAHDAFLQGWQHYKLGARADLVRSIPFFEEAVRLDPGYADAHAVLATIYWDAVEDTWTYQLGIPNFEAEDRANFHLQEALKKPNLLVHVQQSHIYLSQGLFEKAARQAEIAVSLDPNSASAHAALANTLVLTDRPREGLDAIAKAIERDPFHPADYLTILGAAKFGLKDYTAAAKSFERAIRRSPDSEIPLIYLASSFGHLGDLNKAHEAIELANKIRGKNLQTVLKLGGRFAGIRVCGSPEGNFELSRFGPPQIGEHLRAGLSKIPMLNPGFDLEEDTSRQSFDSAMGEWKWALQGPDCILVTGRFTFVDEVKAGYPPYRNTRVLWYSTNDPHQWEGHWVDDYGFECGEEKDGSEAWGQVTFRFNENYTQWKGNFDICGEGAKFPWNGFR